MKEEDLEFHAWPPRATGGQHVGTYGHGVLVIHRPTGIAVMKMDNRSQMRNRDEAVLQLMCVLEDLARLEGLEH